jgi:hypothetical protein
MNGTEALILDAPDITCSSYDNFEAETNENEYYENACRDVEKLQSRKLHSEHILLTKDADVGVSDLAT